MSLLTCDAKSNWGDPGITTAKLVCIFTDFLSMLVSCVSFMAILLAKCLSALHLIDAHATYGAAHRVLACRFVWTKHYLRVYVL